MKIGSIILIIISIIILTTSCSNVSDEIVGTWDYQTFDTRPAGTILCTFDANGNMVRMATVGDSIVYDSCEYVIDNSIFKKKMTITGSTEVGGLTDLNGLFRIEKFKDDILIMTRFRLPNDETAGAYLRCEMIRRH
ncbi:MAG: hypothetical protein PHH30_08910 [Bacteroidales bacterium]|nr:hypothetical protein [Bacteroidales bacterium]MDD3859616.1 hypothetical protein [Bacteroidales bacterium]